MINTTRGLTTCQGLIERLRRDIQKLPAARTSNPAAIRYRASTPRVSKMPTISRTSTANSPAGESTRPDVVASYPNNVCNNAGSVVVFAYKTP